MIRFIKGIFHPGLKGSVIIENSSGIGFEIFVPDNSIFYKKLEGEDVKVYTSMIVREDDVSLYGFHDKESLELFELLITISGVGAKAGMALMSCMPCMELKRAIALGDVKAISSANGVGKKTAERVILELKDKVGTFEGDFVTDESMQLAVSEDSERSQAVTALVTLGYTKSEALTAIGKIKEDDLTCEDYIKKALKDLF